MTIKPVEATGHGQAMRADEAGTQRPLRVALLGPYASRNLGDTATQMAVIVNLRCAESGG